MTAAAACGIGTLTSFVGLVLVGIGCLNHKGVWVPLTPPISSPKIFCKNSFSKSLIKICILCTPPLGWGPFSENP